MTPREYFGRPDFVQCISNGDGTAYCDGELVDSTNMISSPPEEAQELMNYYENKEYRLMICLKFPKRCA